MVIPTILAMTGAEFQANPDISSPVGWMACHFSAYGTGLSNFPDILPKGSFLILNDRTPWRHHDPELITDQLATEIKGFACHGLLLDLQRPGVPEVKKLAELLNAELDCPVGVSKLYADGLSCPVFLPPVPLHQTLSDYLSPWQGREIWLELALDSEEILLEKEGCTVTSLPSPADKSSFFKEETLHCRYHMTVEESCARFLLTRTREDLEEVLAEAEDYGVTTAVGLWQELSATLPLSSRSE